MTTDRETGLAADSMPVAAWNDPQRSRFHFVSPGGWLNDPNGVGQWDGIYHLFYQYNPDAPRHGQIHWGHATSADLVHWVDEPIALEPTPGPDEDGCWSGVLVNDDGVPTLVYSGNHSGPHGMLQLPCVATGDPTLTTWTKDPGNPVIATRPPALDITEFRDHSVWREGGEWQQLIGAGIVGQGGTAVRYTSRDLRNWEYQGPIVIGDASDREPIWTGTTWECVELFELDGVWILVFSAWHAGDTLHPLYYVGDYRDGIFTPRSLHHLDYGLRHFYAPQSFRDESGRRVMFGWLQEARPAEQSDAAGWSGVMSLPRELRLGAEGQLVQAPVDEVASLRGERRALEPASLQPGQLVPLPTDASGGSFAGDQLDLEASLILGADAVVELTVRATADRVERTVVRIDAATGRLELDRSSSSVAEGLDTVPLGGPVPIGDDGRVELRVVLDRSAIEVFANGRSLTARIYPTRADATGLSFSSLAGAVRLERFEVWAMASVWHGPRPLRP
ncbi:glycoside hydrolase family 32 protein [Agromyces albus]|uniref:glycoside hydrolase family 32 protein n=1 Tax=Agromyces albus TaxID=205332 RepID=UPI00278625D1|nr:glycoside hydrolase family 32 protein [Agromyces albus]MDQ0576641.1 beta-fructofuranosidase [Agromyces albus]